MLRMPWPIRDGLEQPQRLPHARRPGRLPGVGRGWDAALDGEAKRGQVRVERVARLVARDVEGRHVRAAETFHQPHGLQALRLVEVAQRRQDDARLDAEWPRSPVPPHRQRSPRPARC